MTGIFCFTVSFYMYSVSLGNALTTAAVRPFFIKGKHSLAEYRKSYKVLLKDPVGPKKGSWLFMDPVKLHSLSRILLVFNTSDYT